MDLELINRITEILTFLQLRTRNANSLHLFDINTRAEFFYRDLLNLVHGWQLKNTNTERMNTAYVDLIDDVSEKKIAIQVTSQNDSAKIRDSVRGFFKNIDNRLFKLKVLLIAKEAKEYRADFSNAGEFKFDAETDVIDIQGLLNQIADKDVDSLREIKAFLEKYVKFSEDPQRASKFYPSYFIPDLKYFVGREELLANLASTLKRHRKASIHDISGLGKTFACYKFTAENQDNYSRIFFVNCAKEAMMESLARLGQLLNLGIEDAPQEQLADAFKNWLETNVGWSAIYDNVDEPSALAPFVPNNPKGHCLFTSNDPKIRNLGNEVSISTLEKRNAAKLLFCRSKADKDAEISFADESEENAFWLIIGNLDGLPVALNTTGAYIEQEGLSFAEYLENLKDVPDLDIGHDDEFDSYKKTVLQAFALAITSNTNQVDELVGKAVDELYRVASLVAPNDIPEEFLRRFLEHDDAGFASSNNQNQFWQKVRKQLQGFDLFKYDSTAKSFSTHRLIQKCILSRSGDVIIEYCEKTLDILEDFFPEYNYNNRDECESYYQHTLTALENADKARFDGEVSVTLYFRVGEYQRLLGNYGEAEIFHKKQFHLSEKIFGGSDNRTAIAASCLAITYKSEGRIIEAERTQKKAIAIGDRSGAGESSDQAARLNNLGEVYYLQGRNDEALHLFKKAAEMFAKIYGNEHSSYATSISNLSQVYRALGKYDEAITLGEQAMKITEHALSKVHPSYAIRLNNLATIYRDQRNYDKAIPLFKRAMKITGNALGKEHPSYAIRLNNLAEVYHALGKLDKAIVLFSKAIEIGEKTIGKEHLTYAQRLNRLAQVYLEQNEYFKALPLFENALRILRAKLPPGHLDIADTKIGVELCKKMIKKSEIATKRS